MKEITTAAELDQIFGVPSSRAANKIRKILHERDKEWLARSPFCLIATAGANGTCDVSPKGDPAGFVRVLDDMTIAIPDRPGNRRVDGFRNIVENPNVGLIFLVPGRTDTLRVNGRARLVRDAPFMADMGVKGHTPTVAIVVAIEEIFHHCSKAFMRSDLWKPETWRPDLLPSRAQIVKSVEGVEETLEELERYYGPEYEKKLYGG
jgi:uncharacterized protein